MIAGLIFWEIILPRIGLKGWSARTRTQRLRRIAGQFRNMAIRLGGVMIKVGQFMSSRVDVLPVEITSELEGLQDEVPSEKFADIRQVAEAEFGMPLEKKFVRFEEQPLAAASLGQAHEAQVLVNEPSEISEGEDNEEPAPPVLLDVVVKVQRPQIEKIISTDMAALRTVGRWLRRYRPIRRRVDISALLSEFSRITYEEIDYVAEGHHAETFAQNFEDEPGVRVPKIIWSHTTKRVLTLENVMGIKITDYDAICEAGIDTTEVATRLLDTYLKQIFEDGFFHADPHPGNLFVQRSGTDENGNALWLLTFIDFGMVGHLPDKMRKGLRELLMGVGTQDSARVVKSYELLGVLLPSADTTLLEKAEARMFEEFWGKNMNELREIDYDRIRDIALDFREIIYSLPFQIPHDLIFLGRTVGILSGMCTGLDPEFNVWLHLMPYAQKIISDESVSTPRLLLNELGNLAQKLVNLPRRTEALLERVERGDLQVRDPELVKHVSRLEFAVLKVAGALVFIGFLVGSIFLYVGKEFTMAGWIGAGAVITLLWIIFGKAR